MEIYCQHAIFGNKSKFMAIYVNILGITVPRALIWYLAQTLSCMLFSAMLTATFRNGNVGIEIRSRTDGGFYKPQRLRNHNKVMLDILRSLNQLWFDNQHQEDGSHVPTCAKRTICWASHRPEAQGDWQVSLSWQCDVWLCHNRWWNQPKGC